MLPTQCTTPTPLCTQLPSRAAALGIDSTHLYTLGLQVHPGLQLLTNSTASAEGMKLVDVLSGWLLDAGGGSPGLCCQTRCVRPC